MATTAKPPQRPALLQAAVNAMLQPDIRRKIMFTFALLVVFRFVANLPVPGIEPEALSQTFENSTVLGFMNIFSGGALQNMSVAAMGVYPYITSSIVIQLLIPIVPTLKALSQEGEQGRRQIQIYTHWLTVPMALVQGYGQLVLIQSMGGISGISLTGAEALPTVSALIAMTAGTMFLVWLGELISEKGIGNGISILIFAGVVAGLPQFISGRLYTGIGGTVESTIFLVVFSIVLVYFIVFVQEAQRRIPVQYARSVFRSGRMYRQSGQTHIPMRVNSAGMIPLIFAFSIIIFPAFVGQIFAQAGDGTIASIGNWVMTAFSPANPWYWIFLFVTVVVFTFFYTLVIFQQQNVAENLQKQGGFIPGIRPGRPTAEYINRVLFRITWAGAFFLGFVAVAPFIASAIFGADLTLSGSATALGISGTSLIIVVGVVLDTMRQIESQLLMRQYEGFIR